MTKAFNARTRITRSLFKPNVDSVADGVWLVQGGFPSKIMNVYLIKDGDGVARFDAGIRAMTKQIAPVAAGPRRRSRASCSGTGTPTTAARRRASACPVFCHPDEVADAEGDGGAHYFDFSKLERAFARIAHAAAAADLGRRPREDRGHAAEGDEVAGLRGRCTSPGTRRA